MMDLKSIVDLVQKAVRVAGPLNRLIDAGTPVMQAVHQQAPELASAIKELVVSIAPPDQSKPKAAAAAITHEEATAAIAKAIFSPHQVSRHEQAWMDRASSTDFG